jgi:hypothetical protein
VTQKTEAIKTRRLKNPPSPRLRRAGADCEVDFFFMDEVELFPSAVNPQTAVAILGEMEQCQHFFEKFALKGLRAWRLIRNRQMNDEASMPNDE